MPLPPAPPFADLLHQTSNVYQLPYDLLVAQVQIESAFDPNAFRYEPAYFDHYIRGKSADQVRGAPYGPLAACSYGLLQILLETALEIGYTDRPERLFDPRVGLAWGAKYLSRLWDGLGRAEGSYRVALARYNGRGPAADAYAQKVYQAAGRSA